MGDNTTISSQNKDSFEDTSISTEGNPAYKTKAIIISSLVIFLATFTILLVVIWILRETRRNKKHDHESKLQYLPSKHQLPPKQYLPPKPSHEHVQQPAELHAKSLSFKHFGIFEMSADAEIVELPG